MDEIMGISDYEKKEKNRSLLPQAQDLCWDLEDRDYSDEVVELCEELVKAIAKDDIDLVDKDEKEDYSDEDEDDDYEAKDDGGKEDANPDEELEKYATEEVKKKEKK